MSEYTRYHIGNSEGVAVLRDNEIFNPKLGIGLYDPRLNKHFEGRTSLELSESEIMRPQETAHLIDMLSDHPAVFVTGSNDQGKSTLLGSFRRVRRETDKPYLYIDGHKSRTDPLHIIAGLRWAKRAGAITVWDNFDYLFTTAKSRRQALSLPKFMDRSNCLLSALEYHVEGGNRVTGTIHSAEWLQLYNADPELQEKFHSASNSLNYGFHNVWDKTVEPFAFE